MITEKYLKDFFLSAVIIFSVYSVFLANFISVFSYVDDVLLLTALLYFGICVILGKATRYQILLYVFIFLAIVFNAIFAKPTSTAFIQAFIHFRLFIYFTFFESSLDEKLVERLIKILFTITLTGLLLNIVMGTTFMHYVGAKIRYRDDLLRYIGFNGHPNNIALIFSVFAIYFYSTRFAKQTGTDLRFLIFLGIFTGLFYITGSRGSLVIIPILYAYHIFRNNTSITLKVCTPFLVLVVLLFVINSELFQLTVSNLSTSTSSGTADAEKYMRTLMIFDSIKLATEHFPFGSGLGTFGTVLSAGSAVYTELGIADNYYVKNGIGVYDSNFASIFGEMGVLGLLLFISILFRTSRFLKTNDMFVPVVLVYICILSIVYPIFQNSPPAISFGLLLAFLKKRQYQLMGS